MTCAASGCSTSPLVTADGAGSSGAAGVVVYVVACGRLASVAAETATGVMSGDAGPIAAFPPLTGVVTGALPGPLLTSAASVPTMTAAARTATAITARGTGPALPRSH